MEEQAQFTPARNTVMRPVWKLIGGAPTMTILDLAQRLNSSVEQVQQYWLAAGFPKADPDKVMFTDVDYEAMKVWQENIESNQLSQNTVTSLMRAQSHMNDRLVLWQLESLVSDLQQRYGLDDSEARLLLLDRIDQYIDLLQQQVGYAWRRQLASLLLTTNQEVMLRDRSEKSPDAYPLERSLGFVDMVAYTRRSKVMNASDLTDLVQRFDSISRSVITSRGGRVVKTIGDAVLYIAHELPVAADIVCALMNELQAEEQMLPVRASLVHGWVVSRSGDIFGPCVNLASRLVDVAHRGTILVDAETAKELKKLDSRGIFQMEMAEKADLRGFGEVEAWTLSRDGKHLMDSVTSGYSLPDLTNVEEY